MQVVHLGGGGAHGKGGIAAGHGQSLEQAHALGAGLAVQLNALQSAGTQTHGRAFAQGIQLVLQRGIAKLGPGLKAGVAAVVTTQQHAFARLGCGTGAHGTHGMKCVRSIVHAPI